MLARSPTRPHRLYHTWTARRPPANPKIWGPRPFGFLPRRHPPPAGPPLQLRGGFDRTAAAEPEAWGPPPRQNPRADGATAPKSRGGRNLAAERTSARSSVPRRAAQPSTPSPQGRDGPESRPEAAYLLAHLRATLAWRLAQGGGSRSLSIDSPDGSPDGSPAEAEALFPDTPPPAVFPTAAAGVGYRWDYGETEAEVRRRAALFTSDRDDLVAADAPLVQYDAAAPAHRLASLTGEDVKVGTESVLLLYDVSKTLVPSDFLRIGQQGQHIEGWNGGLADVVQDLDPITLEPQGRYFLIFHSEGAARQWEDDARRRQLLNRRTTHATGRPPGGWRSAEPSPADEATARSYSLTPPDLFPLRIKAGGSDGGAVARQFRQRMALRADLRRRLRAHHLVLLTVVRGALAKSELGVLIETDAREMNYAWSLIHVLAWDKDVWAELPLRFVLSFALDDDAHRFVRWWHGRIANLTPGAAAEAAGQQQNDYSTPAGATPFWVQRMDDEVKPDIELEFHAALIS